MSTSQTILVHYVPFQAAWQKARKGDEFTLVIHGLEWPAEIRTNPPRVRLLEDFRGGHTPCELLDPWPDAPRYWPPASEPGVTVAPENFWFGYRWWAQQMGTER